LDAFYERLIVRAATIDDLLSDAFEPLPGQKDDADFAARRLAAWCQSSAAGDWSQFGRRLARDGRSIAQALERLATVRRRVTASTPAWIEDALWIEAALQRPIGKTTAGLDPAEPCAFEELFTTVVEQAELLLWSGIGARAFGNLNQAARAGLCHTLLKELSRLCTPPLYERFVKARSAAAAAVEAAAPRLNPGTSRYLAFVADMAGRGFRRLFEDKPVLLRLLATIVRQWIETSRELVLRLDADLAAIRCELLHARAVSPVAKIEGDLSDPHNNGRSVKILSFEDGSRVVYKPKNLELDAAWCALIGRLNRAAPPLELKAVRALSRDGYGWTEFIDHAECTDKAGCALFFRRAGAWLALLHCFVATDMHQENMIACGEHPVPIDLETIFQASTEEHKAQDAEGEAFDTAMDIVGNSVMMVGLLPAYGRAADNSVFAMGGMMSGWNAKTKLKWVEINTDTMRPTKSKEGGDTNPNLPYVDGHYARFADYIEDFIAGFAAYAKFLMGCGKDPEFLFGGFAGLPVRKVVRPTRFYYLLLQRLRNHRTMDDGAMWSAQADFIARLAAWEKESDPLWPLQRAERSALVALNVPHFLSRSDGSDIRDAAGFSLATEAVSGLDRARTRVAGFDARDITWQIEVVRENMNSALNSSAPRASALYSLPTPPVAPAKDLFLTEAGNIAAELSRHAIRRGPGAAWIGLDWLGDSDFFQLVCLGPDLYNGASGIAVFLAAHSAVTGFESSGELACAALSHLRKNLNGRNAARLARSVGIGGATGLGSIVYALSVIAKCLDDDDLLAQALAAAKLFTDDLIAADKQLDVMGGSAGAILGLLRLYRDTQSSEVLGRALSCGEHLLAQPRHGAVGRRSWTGSASNVPMLNGMSHGAAGFAYALASLAAASGREEFGEAAAECVAFEDSSYDPARHNWPDLRAAEPFWPCQWCHGAPGIGLARLATAKQAGRGGKGLDSDILTTDISNAIAGVELAWPGRLDTLCCGTLGSIEFFCEAGKVLERSDLSELAARRLAGVLQAAAGIGDYRWNSGKRQFNLGLFRGLAGVGYTALRQADPSLPNVIIWE
jgi:type 2 lantibiotic biosynthesis protein LanM